MHVIRRRVEDRRIDNARARSDCSCGWTTGWIPRKGTIRFQMAREVEHCHSRKVNRHPLSD